MTPSDASRASSVEASFSLASPSLSAADVSVGAWACDSARVRLMIDERMSSKPLEASSPTAVSSC